MLKEKFHCTKVKKVAKKVEKTEKLQKFSVETVTTFYEVHVVLAKDEEEAQFIAENSDYNASKHLGTQTVQILPCSDDDLKRFAKVDNYFFDGVAKVDDNGYLIYLNSEGKVNENMKPTKIR